MTIYILYFTFANIAFILNQNEFDYLKNVGDKYEKLARGILAFSQHCIFLIHKVYFQGRQFQRFLEIVQLVPHTLALNYLAGLAQIFYIFSYT